MEEYELRKILTQIKKGKVRYFEKIVMAYEHKLYGFIYSIIKDKQYAEDLTQEVFIRVYKHIKDVDPGKSFSAWILTIARNVSYDHIRKHAKVIVVDQIDVGIEASPENDYIKNEFKSSIDTYVQMLPEHLRILIMHKYFEELSYKEISEKENLEIKTVKWQLHDARKKLMKLMDTKEVDSWAVK